jgi:hypothetical protein
MNVLSTDFLNLNRKLGFRTASGCDATLRNHMRIQTLSSTLVLANATVFLSGCSGMSPSSAKLSAPTIAALPLSATAISLRPAKIYSQATAPSLVTVSIRGGTPPYVIKQSLPEVADLIPATRSASSWSFAVQFVASGKTIITVTDAANQTRKLKATQLSCPWLVPQFVQLYPSPNAANVLEGVGQIVMADSAADPLRDQGRHYFVRLFGSDTSVVTGSAFARTSATPPSGSAPGKPYWRATVPRLKPGIKYYVQYATAQVRCTFPWLTGSFRTK